MTRVVEGDLEVFFVQHKFVESNLRNCQLKIHDLHVYLYLMWNIPYQIVYTTEQSSTLLKTEPVT